MLIDGDWSWQKYLSEPGLDAAIALLPTVEETGLPMASTAAAKGYSLSVAARGESRELAIELIRFLTSEDTQRVFLEKQKVLPSRLAVRSDTILQSDPTLRVALEQAGRGPLMPTYVEQRAVWDAMRPFYQALMSGGTHPRRGGLEDAGPGPEEHCDDDPGGQTQRDRHRGAGLGAGAGGGVAGVVPRHVCEFLPRLAASAFGLPVCASRRSR